MEIRNTLLYNFLNCAGLTALFLLPSVSLLMLALSKEGVITDVGPPVLIRLSNGDICEHDYPTEWGVGSVVYAGFELSENDKKCPSILSHPSYIAAILINIGIIVMAIGLVINIMFAPLR